jgi:hypothetical protein
VTCPALMANFLIVGPTENSIQPLGAPVMVQQHAMRHGDIRVSMNYRDAVREDLQEASAKVAARAIQTNGVEHNLTD